MSRAFVRVGVCVVAAAALSACGGAQRVVRTSDLPIKKVVLYQNGVGYFERSGHLDGDVLKLQARPSQINDLLKSLTVIDRGKGRPVSVSLPMEKSQALRLSELPPQVRNASGLLDVLTVFRGAMVDVTGDSGSVSGRVVGVEDLNASHGDKTKPDWRLTLKTDSGELLVYPVRDIHSIAMRDRTLAIGLDQSLDVSLGAQNWKPVELEVRLAGSHSHDLIASYIVEMPRWKPAYRLVLNGDGKPLLQGWAVVDNVSGEDWNKVALSLVAGNPISFIYDLHSPQFTQRVDLTPRGQTTAMAPTIEENGYGGEDDEAEAPEEAVASEERPYEKKKDYRRRRSMAPPPAPKSAPAPMGGLGSGRSVARGPSMSAAEMSKALEQQSGHSAGGQQVGSLFRYDLNDHVSVSDRSSTMVAIVNERVPGKEIVLFRPEGSYGVASMHPYRAVMFKNDSGFSLEKGPVAIYSAGTFVGESFLDRLEKKATSFLTFSMDGSVSLKVDQERRNEGMRLLKVIDGMLVSEVLGIERAIYSVENRHDKPVVAYVKTARKVGWKLRNAPKKGVVDSGNYEYLPVTVPASKTGKLTVEWVKPTETRVAIDSSMATTLLRGYLASGKVSPGLRAQIEKMLKIKSEIADIDSDTARLNKQHKALSDDQYRVRMNLNLLQKTKGNAALTKELTNKLADQERQLGKISGELVRLSERKATLQNQLKVLIRTITIKNE